MDLKELEELMTKKYAVTSERNVKWAVKNYSQWRVDAIGDGTCCDPRLLDADKHSTKNLEKASFAFAMCKFITRVIKVNGEDYPLNTLKELVYCIQMFLHMKRVFWYMLDKSDIVFLDMYYVLDNEMKQCTSEGLGVVKSATPVSITTEDKLWKEGKFGEENGTQLVQTMMFLLGVNAGLRGGLEHKHLRQPGFNPQFNIIVDEDGFKCLQFWEDPKTKNHQGGMSVDLVCLK